MLDPGPDEAGRDALAQDVKGRIEGKGTLKHESKWGLRKMAYEIEQRNEADYRWFRFEAPTELLDELNHNLRIADGVLRFRIFKVDADTPVVVPPATAAAGPAASRERPSQGAPQTATADSEAEAPAPEVPVSVVVAEVPAEAEPVAETPEPATEAPQTAAEPEAPEAPDENAEGEPGDSAA
jgi:small subunit ribosomal protein S6